MDIHCPFCEHEFEGEVWQNGKCPNCKEKYYWEDLCTEDYSVWWASVEWENIN